jgi:DNA-binding response OmpR family regulator/HPt (histidine-containing phosphotransfer) domain-containing protein
MKILLVEDDEYTASLISNALTAHHYLVNTTENGQTGLELTAAYDYDLILLDVLIPGMDGMSLCRQLRAQGCQMPILMLTAQNTSGDRIRGLEAGADDYVVKPFDLSELVARVKALLRRRQATLHTVLTWENLKLDLSTNEVSYSNRLLHLTPKEYGLLELFLRNPRRIFNRSSLLDNVWNVDEFPGERAVTTQIKGLRQKFKKAGMTTEFIETVYGLGYRLKPDPMNSDPDLPSDREVQPRPSVEHFPHAEGIDRKQAEAEVTAAIAKVWEKFKVNLPPTFELFEQIGTQLMAGNVVDYELKQQAILESHRLIGTLGAFGVLQGSELARHIEQLLRNETQLGQGEALQLSEWVAALKQAVNQDREDQRKKSQDETVNQPMASVEHPVEEESSFRHRLLVVDDDVELAEQIQIVSRFFSFQIEIATNLAQGRQAIAQEAFDAVLLDLTFAETGENGLTFLAELMNQNPSLPVLVMTGRKRLMDRVEVARLGGRAFLQKPILPHRLLEMANQVLTQSQEVGRRILVVDDDPLMLTTLAALLEPWGLQVNTLDDPQQFWEVLEAFAPDLLILDVEMPYFNGLELCKAVRNDPYWGELPVLFLTAHQDTEVVRQIFMVGADDYVRKPIVEPEIVARVLNRLERVRARRKWMGNEVDLEASATTNVPVSIIL